MAYAFAFSLGFALALPLLGPQDATSVTHSRNTLLCGWPCRCCGLPGKVATGDTIQRLLLASAFGGRVLMPADERLGQRPEP